MKIYTADFIAGAAKPEQIPELNLPEVAFSGRSNVGKSSLLNSIVHRKNLAHTSNTPGKTQQINFYSVENRWIFADMPGFGYASTSKTNREEWSKLNYAYLEKRDSLSMVCSLVDCRHDPMPADLAFIEWLELNGKKFIIILTKSDKISKNLIEERKKQVEDVVRNCTNCLEVLPYSAITGKGREQLLAIINRECV